MIIDDRLLLPFPFYDSLDKQSWRQDKCFGNLKTFQTLTDNTRFPPFEIFIDGCCDGGASGVIDAGLYDTDDMLVYDLITSYNIDDYIDIKSDSYGVWLIYNSSSPFLTNLPSGMHYIKIEYCEKIYYSEIVNICDKDFIYPYKHYITINDTDGKGATWPIIGNAQFSPTMYQYNNKTYGAWMAMYGTGYYDSVSYVYAYDHTTDTLSANYDLGTETAGNTDTHGVPAIIVADDGHIVVAAELPRIGYNNHNDKILVKRSDNEEDETSWVNAIAHNAGYYTEIGDSTTNRLAYPVLYKTCDGTIYLIVRLYNAAESKDLRIYKSTDHAVSFTLVSTFIDPSASVNDWMYPLRIDNSTSDIIRIVTRYYNDATGNSEDVYYLESDDGVTWYNIGRTWSKNTVAVAAITKAELDTNCLVVSDVSSGYDTCTPLSATIDDDGYPIIHMEHRASAATDAYHYAYIWDGSSWVGSLVVHAGLRANTAIIYKGDDFIELWCTDYNADGQKILVVYETQDRSTWTYSRTIMTDTPGTGNYMFNCTRPAGNYKDAKYEIYVTIYSDNLTHSDLALITKESITNNHIILNYSHSCDDQNAFGKILYQTGFNNRIIFQEKNDLVRPEYETIKEAVSRRGHVIVTSVVTKKAHKLIFYAPEFMADAIKLLPAHDTIILTDKNGDSADVVEVDVDITPAGNCFFKIDLTLYVGPLHTTNCCNNFTIS